MDIVTASGICLLSVTVIVAVTIGIIAVATRGNVGSLIEDIRKTKKTYKRDGDKFIRDEENE
jgi:hypothetical protein